MDSVNVDYIPKAIVSAEYGLRMIYTSENGKYTATMEISPEEFKESGRHLMMFRLQCWTAWKRQDMSAQKR